MSITKLVLIAALNFSTIAFAEIPGDRHPPPLGLTYRATLASDLSEPEIADCVTQIERLGAFDVFRIENSEPARVNFVCAPGCDAGVKSLACVESVQH